MADRLPIVVNAGQLQQLQPGDDAVSPSILDARADRQYIALLVQALIDYGVDTLPQELIDLTDQIQS